LGLASPRYVFLECLLTKVGWLVISIATDFVAIMFFYRKGFLTPRPTYLFASYDVP
jgi:hypothetical protein